MTSMFPPPSPDPATHGSAASGLSRFLESLGDSARLRPVPRLGRTIVATGGMMLPVGIAVTVSGDSSSLVGIYVTTLVVFGLAVTGRVRGLVPEYLVAGSTSAALVSLVVFMWTVVADAHIDVGVGLIMVALACIACWMAPGFRGANLFIGTGAFALLSGIGALFSSHSVESSYTSELPIDVPNVLARSGYAYLVTGALLIVAVNHLDRRNFSAVATSLVPAALVGVVIGLGFIVQDMNNSGAGLLLCAVGLGAGVTGTAGGRRGLTWVGTALFGIGLVVFLAFSMKPDSTSSVGAVVLVAAILMLVGPRLAESVRRSTKTSD